MNMRILFTIMITVITTIMTTIIHYRTIFNESGLSLSRRSKRRLWNSRSCQATLVPPATTAMCATWRLGAQGSRQRSEKIWIFPQNPRKVGILLPTSMEKCNSTKHPQTKWVMFLHINWRLPKKWDKIGWGHPAQATATGCGAPGVLRRAGAGTQRWAMLGHGGHDGHGGHPQVITIDGIPTIVMLGLWWFMNVYDRVDDG